MLLLQRPIYQLHSPPQSLKYMCVCKNSMARKKVAGDWLVNDKPQIESKHNILPLNYLSQKNLQEFPPFVEKYW